MKGSQLLKKAFTKNIAAKDIVGLVSVIVLCVVFGIIFRSDVRGAFAVYGIIFTAVIAADLLTVLIFKNSFSPLYRNAYKKSYSHGFILLGITLLILFLVFSAIALVELGKSAFNTGGVDDYDFGELFLGSLYLDGSRVELIVCMRIAVIIIGMLCRFGAAVKYVVDTKKETEQQGA